MLSPSLGFSFIFRDDVATIEQMLASMAEHFDQIVAVDTGSSDGSRAIVERVLEQRNRPEDLLLDFEWDGRDDPHALLPDFAAARQHGWERLATDWGVWADADDVVEGAEHFRRVAMELPTEIGAAVMPYDYAQAPSGACVCTLNRERLVRLDRGWRWISPVHEVLISPNPGGFLMVPMIVYRHRKQPKPLEGDRNLRIIQQHITEAAAKGEPPDPRMQVYYGVELAVRGQHAEAVEAYKQYLAIAQWGEEKHQALHRMADSLRALGSFEEAMQVETYAMTHAAEHGVAEWADHLSGVGESLLAMGKAHHAIPWFERALLLGMPQSNLILNPRDYDYQIHFQLAIALAQTLRLDEALEQIAKAEAIMQGDPALEQNKRMILAQQREQKTIQTTIDFLETLIRYDENLKARRALDVLPYAARANERVQQLAAHIRSSTFQIDSREGYARMYETNRETRNPDDLVRDASVRLSRVQTLAQGLRKQLGLPVVDANKFAPEPGDDESKLQAKADKLIEALSSGVPAGSDLRLLDAGCNDGWVAAHIEAVLHLAVADGVDLNKEAIEAAVKRKADFNLQGEYREGFVEDSAELFGEERYDAIALFEVFEHLVDPHESVGKLEQALKPGGRIYISTPAGAYESGLIDNWQQNTAKQHLRAVTPTEFARFALQRGQLTDFVLGWEGVQTLSYRPMARKGRIVMYAGGAWEPWSPHDINERGLGGSETAMVELSNRLADKGWLVEVYAGLRAVGPIDGVLYRDFKEYDPGEYADVLVSSRVPQVADFNPNRGYGALWCHDAHVGRTLRERIDKFDAVWTLSAAQERALREFEGLTDPSFDAKFGRTRNGLDLSRWPAKMKRFRERDQTVIYSSSPDRGLDTLVGLWPLVKKAVPNAKLKVFYGFDVFDQIHAQNPQAQEWKKGLMKRIEDDPSIELVGRVDQKRLAREQSAARVWAYPYQYENPTETSCITAMEAMAAGMFIVATESGALPETIGNVARTIPGSNDNFPVPQFVQQIVKGLTDEKAFMGMQQRSKQRVQGLTWDAVADEWDEIFTASLETAVLTA